MISARDYALVQLDARRLPGWPSGLLRRRGTLPAAAQPEDPRDQALAQQLIVGVIKNLLHLQWLIAHWSGRSLRQIDPLAQKILAIGLYQLRFLQRIPQHAAVDEAVKQAKRVGHPRAAGFINAVLHRAIRQPDPPLPDRDTDPAAYAQTVLSHPRELFQRLSRALGDYRALQFCEHDNREPPTIVRLIKGAQEHDLHACGVQIQAHAQQGMYVVAGTRPPLLADWLHRGIAAVQDPASARVVPLMDVQPGQSVLDRCCGLGTKTMQIAEAMGGQGIIVAIDPAESRLAALRQVLDSRGIANVAVHKAAMLRDLPADTIRKFDRILVDVPCSNSGVLARRPEARYAQDARSLSSLVRLQDQILDDTVPALAPGGILVYSTCSIWSHENEDRVQAMLLRHPGLRLVDQSLLWPSYDTEDPSQYHSGGYAAIIRRVSC